MKTKLFAVLAMSGLLTASIAYVTPAMAEESANELPMEQTLADNNVGSSMQTPPADNSAQSQSSAPSQGDMSGNNGNGNSSSGSSDEGSPDTATGDDDY